MTSISATPTAWDALPPDAIQKILALSQSPRDLLAAAGVSRRWREVAKQPALVSPQLRKLGLSSREIAGIRPDAIWQAMGAHMSVQNSMTRGRFRVRTLLGHTAFVYAVAFNAQGTHAVTGAADSSARVWSLDDPTSFAKIVLQHRPETRIDSAAFNAAGTHVLTRFGPANGLSRGLCGSCLWDLSRPTKPTSFAEGIADFDASMTRVVVGSRDGVVSVYSTQDPTAPLARVQTGLGLGSFQLSGNLLAVGGGQGQCQVWDLRRPASPPVSLWGPHHAGVVANNAVCVMFNAAGSHLITSTWGFEGGTAHVWNLQNPAQPLPLERDGVPLNAASFDPEGDHVITGADNGRVGVWSLASPQTPRAMVQTPERRIHTVSLSGVEKYGLVLGAHRTASPILIDLAPGTGPRARVLQDAAQDYCTSAALNAQGTLLFSMEDRHRGMRYEGYETFVRSTAHPEAYVNLLAAAPDAAAWPAFDPTGTRLLAGSEGGALRLFEFDLSAPPFTDSATIDRAREVCWRSPSLVERAWVAAGPCVGLPLAAGAFGIMALTSPVSSLLPPQQGPTPSFRGCVAGAAICAGLSLFSGPWLVAGFLFPRAAGTLGHEIFEQIRALALSS